MSEITSPAAIAIEEWRPDLADAATAAHRKRAV
jgi:hypothetical protein